MTNHTEWHRADLRVLVPFSFSLFRQPPVIQKWPFFCVWCNLDRPEKDGTDESSQRSSPLTSSRTVVCVLFFYAILFSAFILCGPSSSPPFSPVCSSLKLSRTEAGVRCHACRPPSSSVLGSAAAVWVVCFLIVANFIVQFFANFMDVYDFICCHKDLEHL